MIKETLDKNKTVEIGDKELAVLKENFPGCFNSKGEFDFTLFRNSLGEKVDIVDEGYELKFLGKEYGRLLAALDTETVIVPDKEYNSLPENKDSQNIYITGDNLDGLKHLLKSYQGKIDVIYIDPPYNTGSDDFSYSDDFEFTPEVLSNKLDIEIEEAERILNLSKRGASSHSAWLTFLLPRLILSRDLLSSKGIIFVSIDDNEMNNLELILDEIFGETNRLATLPRVTKKSGKDHTNGIASNHDYVVGYAKNKERAKLKGLMTDQDGYTFKDEHFKERGPYKLNQTLDYNSLWYNPKMDYEINLNGTSYFPGGSKVDYQERHKGNHSAKDWVWRWGKDKLKFGIENDFLVIKDTGERPRIYTKTYFNSRIGKKNNNYFLEQIDRESNMSSLALCENTYSNDNATKDLGKLLDKNLFDYPKPVNLILTLLELVETPVLVLDFFSGSGTTAQAVLEYNINRETKTNFIMIQKPEIIKNVSEIDMSGFETIDQIGMERIRRSAEQLSSDVGHELSDLGFKHFVLEELPEETIDKIEDFDTLASRGIADMEGIGSSIDKDTLLTTWINNDGYGLSREPEVIDLSGYPAYYMKPESGNGGHIYLVDKGLTEDAIDALICKYEDEHFNPEIIVLFGYNFNYRETTELKQNLQRLDKNGIDSKVTIETRY